MFDLINGYVIEIYTQMIMMMIWYFYFIFSSSTKLKHQIAYIFHLSVHFFFFFRLYNKISLKIKKNETWNLVSNDHNINFDWWNLHANMHWYTIKCSFITVSLLPIYYACTRFSSNERHQCNWLHTEKIQRRTFFFWTRKVCVIVALL